MLLKLLTKRLQMSNDNCFVHLTMTVVILPLPFTQFSKSTKIIVGLKLLLLVCTAVTVIINNLLINEIVKNFGYQKNKQL